jgi:hypothetical protein
MTKIIQLMDQKNHFLEQFCTLGEKTLADFSTRDFSSLEYFYKTREEILKLIAYVDAQVDKEQKEYSGEIDPQSREQLKECFKTKDRYVSRILRLDLEILAMLDSEKTMILRDLQGVQKTRKALGGYRSRSLVQRLNEEA